MRNPRLLANRTLPILGLLILALILWLPEGFAGGLTGDAWRYFSFADAGTVFENMTSLDRPMLPLSWWLGYAIAPATTYGINLLIMLMLLGKGAFVVAFLLRLGVPFVVAASAGALTIVFPADSGIFYLGALAIHFAAFFYFAALYLLVEYWKRPRLIVALLMNICLLITVNIYEISLILVVFSPLVLLIIGARLNGRFYRVLLLWFMIPMLRVLASLLLVIYTRAYGYQAGLISGDTSFLEVFSAVGVIYSRHFLTGWTHPHGESHSAYFVFSLFSILTTVLMLSFINARQESVVPNREMSNMFKWLMLGSFLFVLVSTSLYLATVDRTSSLRTSYYSSAGAAVFIANGLWLLIHPTKRSKMVYAIIIGGLVGLGTLRLLEQRRGYLQTWNAMSQLPVEVSAIAPSILPSTVLIIFDDTADNEILVERALPSSTWYLQSTLNILYKDVSLRAAYCFPEITEAWGADQERCSFEENGVLLTNFNRSAVYPYDMLVALRYDGDSLSLVEDLSPYTTLPAAMSDYAPTVRILQSAPPERLNTMFADNEQ